MQTEVFVLKNANCGGGAANIVKGLGALSSVPTVDVRILKGEVTLTGDNINRAPLATRLREIGYLESHDAHY